MKLNPHEKNIINYDDWKIECPPKKADKQWKPGRSAMELAKYMTEKFPNVPSEIENALKVLVPESSNFDWDAEYVTPLPGRGEGRNHDAILWNEDIVVTIEAKADEPLGNLIIDEMKGSSVNKLCRISEMLKLMFKGNFKKYGELRYQLLTASVGTILEAQKQGCDIAVLLVLVFKTNGNVTEEKLFKNHTDIEQFFEATNAYEENGFMVIPNNTDVKLLFKEIVI